jgi:hypothetical protein
MNAIDKQEMRQMIEDLLAPVYLSNINTGTALNEINNHLKDLNGKVASHEKIINSNLPHTISHCNQSDNIEELKKSMISNQAISRTIKQSIATTGTVVTILFVIYQVITRYL